MDWKREAKAELRNYRALQSACENIPLRLQAIRASKTSIKSSGGATPVQGGGNHYEDRLLDLIVEEERLRHTLKANRIRLALIERGLAVLSDTERTVALTFAEHRSGAAVDLLADQIDREAAQIYRIWNTALYKFTLAEYGITEY